MNNIAFHEYLQSLIDKSPLTMDQVAKSMGYESSKIITCFNEGRVRVPIEKLPSLAQALGVEPRLMIRRYLREYSPQMLTLIDRYFGGDDVRN